MTKGGGQDLRQVVEAREQRPDLVGHAGQRVLEQASVVVVEVVEQEVRVAGTLVIGDPTVGGVVSVGVTKDRRSDEWIRSHVVEPQRLHQPDGLPVHRRLPLPPPLAQRGQQTGGNITEATAT